MTESKAMIVGVAGKTLNPEEEAFIRAERPWGFILFARNIDRPKQVRGLTDELRELRRAAATQAVREHPQAPPAEAVQRFLTARWSAYHRRGSVLLRTPADHPPWPLHAADVERWDVAGLFDKAGLPVPEAAPLAHFSPGVTVSEVTGIFPAWTVTTAVARAETPARSVPPTSKVTPARE
jgi:hypothetical protein